MEHNPFDELYSFLGQVSNALSKQINAIFTFGDDLRHEHETVLYDKNIYKNTINQNKTPHNNPLLNRRLQTKRVMTHIKK